MQILFDNKYKVIYAYYIVSLILSLQFVADAQLPSYDAKRIIVTFDCSGSMSPFPHDRMGEYVAKMLFDGITKNDLFVRDQWAVMAGINESVFQTPLLQSDTEWEIYRFSNALKRMSISELTRNSLLSIIPQRRDIGGQTDIASLVEIVCQFSENDIKDGGPTLWIFVSDDMPNSTLQRGQQAQRLRALELVYRWDTVLRITVDNFRDPPMVEVRQVSNRLYDSYSLLINQIKNEQDPLKASRKIEDLNQNINDILKEMENYLPKELIDEILRHIEGLKEKAEEELYKMKLGIFDLIEPGLTDTDSRFVEGEKINFSWTKPGCNGVSHYILKILNNGGDTIREFETEQTNYNVSGLEAGSYKWTVVSFGEGRISAFSYMGDGFDKWREFRVVKPLGPITLVEPKMHGKVTAGDVLFKWSESIDADTYKLEIITSNGDVITSERNTTEATESLPIGLSKFRVTAFGANRFPYSVSEFQEFEVVAIGGPPTLVSPQKNENILPGQVAFVWNPVEQAESYIFELKGPEDSIHKETVNETAVSIDCIDSGFYLWRVASLQLGEAMWCQEGWRTFSIRLPAIVPPVLIEPAANKMIYSDRITFSWRQGEAADLHSLLIRKESGEMIHNIPSSESAVSLELTDLGDYQWSVESSCRETKQGPIIPNEGWRLLKRRELPKPFNLLQPHAESRPFPLGWINFIWEPSLNSRGYKLILFDQFNQKKEIDGIYIPNHEVFFNEQGIYSWTIYAIAEDGTTEVPAAGDPRSFTVSEGIAPEIRSPYDGATVYSGGEVTFRWTRAQNVDVKSYLLQIYQADAEGYGELILSKETKDNKLSVPLEPGDYACMISAICGPELKLDSTVKSHFTIKLRTVPPVEEIWKLLIMIFTLFIFFVLLWLYIRPISVEIRSSEVSILMDQQRVIFDLTRFGTAKSCIYLYDTEEPNCYDVGASGFYIKRNLLKGLTLYGPGGKIMAILFDEEFEFSVPEGPTIRLTIEKYSPEIDDEDVDGEETGWIDDHEPED